MAFAVYRPSKGDWLGSTAGGVPPGYTRTTQRRRDLGEQTNVLTWGSCADAVTAARKASNHWRDSFTVVSVSASDPNYAIPDMPMWRPLDDYGAEVVSHISGKDTDVAQPLNVTRTKLIKALQDAQKRIQAEADEARAAALSDLNEIVAALTSEASATTLRQVATYVTDRYVVTQDGKKQVVHGYRHAASAKDETIEKQLRVLQLSEDKTIEVTPTDDFYRYL